MLRKIWFQVVVMPINLNRPERWKSDIAQSVDMYNRWFLQFAPRVYRETRLEVTEHVKQALAWTANLADIEPRVLRQYPSILPTLRMTTAPPIARDRLIGLAGVEAHLVESMETRKQLPPRMTDAAVHNGLHKIAQLITQLADKDIFTWLEE